MLKALWFILRAGLLVAAVIWLARNPGHIEVTWQGYLIETSMAFLVTVFALFLFVWTLAVRVWRSFVSVPKTYRRYHVAMAREKGYRAVTEGLVAVAAGDGRAAEKLAARAESLIPGTPLTRLLTAQTALMNGNSPKARREFAALLEDDSAAFFGVRGLLNDTLRKGDYREALDLARKAEKLQPKRLWVIRTLFDLETRNRDWAKAGGTLKKAEKIGLFDQKTGQRHRQALLLAQATEELGSDREATAFKHAEQAVAIDPAFTPAAVMMTQLYDRRGRRRAAIKTLEAAWRANPHPALAALWMNFAPPPKKTRSLYDAGREIYDWTKRLYDLKPGHHDSERALGIAAMQARMWREARQHLEQAADFRTLARLEREESGDEARAREWLEKAADALPEPRWVCGQCGHTAQHWQALCGHCQSFDRISWMVPGMDDGFVTQTLLEKSLGASSLGATTPMDGDVISPPPLSVSAG